MKNTIKKGLSLGLGLAVVSKEQAEKVVNELVEKGELSKEESREYFNDLVEKGQSAKAEFDERINEKFNELKTNMIVATKAEVADLKERIEQLEIQLQNKQK